MNILYVYGYLGSPEGNTVRLLREAFPDDTVICETYPQEDFNKAVSFLSRLVDEKKIDVVMASSLGAFIALHLPNAPKAIVINPCMEPCSEILHLPPVPGIEKALETYQAANDTVWEHKRSGNVIGCFSYKDSVLSKSYKDLFKEHYGDVEMLSCDHRLDASALPIIKDCLKKLGK